MKRFCLVLGTLAGVVILVGRSEPLRAMPQQPKSGNPAKVGASLPTIEAIDSTGEPKQAAVKAIPGPKVCLGYYDDGWQIQLKPGNVDWTRIDGSIEVIGGEIARVSGFGDLETATPGKKNEHADQGKFDKRHIDFKVWVKKGGTDTFRFYLSDDAQTIRCRFRISGQLNTESVLIGRGARHPSQADFVLQAHPSTAEKPARKDTNPKPSPP